jgi:plasmid stabilization system protein ParE
MKIRLLPVADRDLERGAAFYESQSPGLGTKFVDSLISDIDSLVEYRGIHERFKGYYRSLSSRFPYLIYDRIDDETIRIHAVLDARQNPDVIDERLRKTNRS